MTGGTQLLTGIPEGAPLVEEQVAIDATFALRGAEAGIRAFRSRSLLGRIWDGIVGDGQELESAIKADLLAAQRATLSLVKTVMQEESRTQRCVHSVLVNLEAVNRDLDLVEDRVVAFAARLDEGLAELHNELIASSQQLLLEIGSVRRRLDRHVLVQQLTEQHRAGELHAGFGSIASAALFVAHIARCYAPEERAELREQRRASLAVAKLPGTAAPDEELIYRFVHEISSENVPAAHFVFAPERGPFCASVAGLLERRLAELPVREEHVREQLVLTRRLRDPARSLVRLIRPHEFVEALSAELTPPLPGLPEVHHVS